jgi:hypothetical protein
MIKEIALFSDTVLIDKKSFEDNTFNAIALSNEFPIHDLKGIVFFEIVFSSKIHLARTSSYEWTEDFQYYCAGPLSPKIVKLESGLNVQANCTLGFWEIDTLDAHKLIWRLNPESSRILAQYEGPNNFKVYQDCPEDLTRQEIKLLLTDKKPLEWSRSKIPFSAVACFTDHCDFDTPENLKLQRKFFKESGIKVTKGIFLNHFSKRNDNASWENDSDELKKWVTDGHELAYHSLSQSIKTEEESSEDFQNFKAPVSRMPVWIDHGFQPYNLSLLNKNKKAQHAFFSAMRERHINVFWNYIDSGTSTEGVVNQLDLRHFTLNSFFRGTRNYGFKDKLTLRIKNIFFHYYASEEIIANYKSLASKVKKVLLGGKINMIPNVLLSFSKVLKPLLSVVMNWNSAKNRIYPLAKHNPVLFSFSDEKQETTIFQTLEMLDFTKTLSKKSLDTFVRDKGLFIAHTYFSVPMRYHKGRMFVEPDRIDNNVKDNFNYLGTLIRENAIWNPTLSELVEYNKVCQQLLVEIDEQGDLFMSQNKEVHFRYIN